jgi:hypothetical protein
MTLHETKVLLIKTGIGSLIGAGSILVLVILFWIGIGIKNIYLPPKVIPPTLEYGLLPAMQFPQSSLTDSRTYELQTITGDLPTDLPDRLTVFPIKIKPPNFLNLDKVKQIAKNLEFTGAKGVVIPEIQLSNTHYEWNETINYRRKLVFNIHSFDFTLTSEYLRSLTALSAQYISNESSAIATVQNFLKTMKLTPDDLDITKTNTPNNAIKFVTYPQLFSIITGGQGLNTLVPASSLSKTQTIRVDLYQKDIEYELNTGQDDGKKTIPVKIPIIYPYPPYSTMSFWVASGSKEAIVAQAFYTHKDIDLKNTAATYPLKTPKEAFSQLEENNAYIASYSGNDQNIIIKNVFLAYYLGADEPQQYLMPVYVFEGNNGFYAYVPAVDQAHIQP